jgi:thioredoxin 1
VGDLRINYNVSDIKQIMNNSIEDFNNLIEGEYVMIFFFSKIHREVKAVLDVIKDLKKTIRVGVQVYELDVDENTEIVKKYEIKKIPSVMMFKNSNPVDLIEGLSSKQSYIEMVRRNL